MKRMNCKRIFRIGIMAGMGAFLLSGCLNNDWEECEKQGKDELDKYISSHNISGEYKKDDGLYYIPDTVGTGLSPEVDNYVVVSFTGMYLNGTIIETTESSMKDQWDAPDIFSDYPNGSTKFRFGYSRPGFNSGLSYMQEGGWATLIIPMELAFYSDCKPVKYTMHLLSVIKDPVGYEKTMMLQCLAENGMDTVSNAYGAIYFKEYASSGDTLEVMDNDTLLIRFSGKYPYMDNGKLVLKVFDSNLDDDDPLKIIYGKDILYGGSILSMPDGFTAALDTMRKGSRAIAVLPYGEAFGTTGLIKPIYYYYIVPAYQTVIYDLYLEDIIRGEQE
jgi:FKBP-type peptidyl-prolyl cis-trans isomerase